MDDRRWQPARLKRQIAPPGTHPVACQPREPAAAVSKNPDMLGLAPAARTRQSEQESIRERDQRRCQKLQVRCIVCDGQ